MATFVQCGERRNVARGERPGKAPPALRRTAPQALSAPPGRWQDNRYPPAGRTLAQRLPAAGGSCGGVTVREGGDVLAPQRALPARRAPPEDGCSSARRSGRPAQKPGSRLPRTAARCTGRRLWADGWAPPAFFCGLPQTLLRSWARLSSTVPPTSGSSTSRGAQRRPEGTPAAAFCVFHGSASFCISNTNGRPFMQKGRDAVWIKTENPNKKTARNREDFWLTLEPLPAPDPGKAPAAED